MAILHKNFIQFYVNLEMRMVKKIIILVAIFTTFLLSNEVLFENSSQTPRPIVNKSMLKSAIAPGWGEWSLGYKNRSIFFATVEVINWIGYYFKSREGEIR